MKNYITAIEEFWQIRDSLTKDSKQFKQAKQLVKQIVAELDNGNISVCEKINAHWQINEWVKKAILLGFKTSEMQIYDGNCMQWYDKINPKFGHNNQETLKQSGVRMVPGAFVRHGAYLGKNVVVMPSFINIGAYVGDGTLIDTWATIGSCAHIGKNCHISGGAGIGGVLEPLQAAPVIVEDNCFIGARSEIVEGVLVEEGSVISMGVFIGASTKIIERDTGKIIYGKIPAYSVVVPGSLPANKPGLPSLYCAVIIKQVDEKTRAKTSINELLRE
ncbi:MAG: 2,3,4,5-tetrahydropyridine-2,6-dicarboxylate N-succinyltransferase [Rickettsiaceae bacterium]|nr:2,3,4,5-tetrahydropyridine-2,6-dicarboxylate N-succinyltransferase [Rickettsiaceae bacterium]MDP4832836.1 2,3,4,5-tetrahydropyridine-2,6-dicarboxylate N-succinyltransferase [Rickettsiaceae bacterium]MDP5021121.1 2,3,4,5-tetrahydropyridine-2,6-dicarboxylate N-succinyltransferase [Rickettsiaceae bacterium]MDP5082730.1 2,3,4,5-tetrahydropyridine-2,6-dicarboxylate N-succinyltransferase [Rickettsiaceae bacterium]